MSRKPIYSGGTKWVNLPLPAALFDRLLSDAGGDKRKMALSLSAIVVAASDVAATVTMPPANERPA